MFYVRVIENRNRKEYYKNDNNADAGNNSTEEDYNPGYDSDHIATVLDQQVDTSSAHDGHKLIFPSVHVLSSVASSMLIASSATSSALASFDITATKKSSSPIVGLGPPLTDGFVDTGFGSIYEPVGFTGGLILVSSTSIWWICKKQATLAYYYSITKPELYATTEISKLITWLCVLMADTVLPYFTATVIVDKKVMKLHIKFDMLRGKEVASNVRHGVIQIAALQQDIFFHATGHSLRWFQ